MMLSNYDRVQKGIAFLDRHGPPDWREQIDPDKIDIKNCGNCVLGQIYGSYVKGLKRLGLSMTQAVDHGFHPREAPTKLEAQVLLKDLNQEWRLALRQSSTGKRMGWVHRLIHRFQKAAFWGKGNG